MNVLFLTIIRITDITERGIYTDLMRKFRDEGHNIFIACPSERRYKETAQYSTSNGVSILNVKTLNLQKTNLLEKGLATILLEYQFLKAAKSNFSTVKFDLILYSTPPITFYSVIRYFKIRDKAKSYLLLKDIFPQNAVDLKMIRKGGFLHRYFRRKETLLYSVSDFIGCMSPANVEYILNHNVISKSKVEVNPNSIDPVSLQSTPVERNRIRKKYEIPEKAVVFIYGGNLGKPQGVEFLKEIIQSNSDKTEAFFVVAGSGVEYMNLDRWFSQYAPQNAVLLSSLQKSEYDSLAAACDVGLILLNYNFSIPNFPSRILSYMECQLPVLTATDPHTDIGKVVLDGGFGLSSLSGDIEGFNRNVQTLIENRSLRERMGEQSLNYLKENFHVRKSYEKIMTHFHAL